MLTKFRRNRRRIIVPANDVATFNSRWPCSTLRTEHGNYIFEFDVIGDLIDCDVPESDDGPAASAMADDCREFMLSGIQPDWAS